MPNTGKREKAGNRATRKQIEDGEMTDLIEYTETGEKRLKWPIAILLVLGVLVIAGSIIGGCQTQQLSDEQIDRMVDRMVDRMEETEDPDEIANRMIDALLTHPGYLELIEDAWQVPPDRECATIILTAGVMTGNVSGDYSMPDESEVEDLCKWYVDQVE